MNAEAVAIAVASVAVTAVAVAALHEEMAGHAAAPEVAVVKVQHSVRAHRRDDSTTGSTPDGGNQ